MLKFIEHDIKEQITNKAFKKLLKHHASEIKLT